MRYVEEKYGKESVAQIVTFGKMLPRNATRDAARVLGLDYGAGDRLAKLIPEPIMGRSSRSSSTSRRARPAPRLRLGARARQIIDTARGLEGIVRHAGIHAAVVVIADRPLTDIVPVQLMEDRGALAGRRALLQGRHAVLDEADRGDRLLKMDFLGLRNLDVIEDCLSIIEESTGQRPDMATLPLDDPKTYEMMARGDSIGVFQFESDGMREAAPQGQADRVRGPGSAERPLPAGRDGYIDTYARNKRNPDPITYLDERLRLITEATYSVILYQEQSMQIAKSVAGFSGAEADDPQGDRQEEPRGDGRPARALRGGARRAAPRRT